MEYSTKKTFFFIDILWFLNSLYMLQEREVFSFVSLAFFKEVGGKEEASKERRGKERHGAWGRARVFGIILKLWSCFYLVLGKSEPATLL